MLSKPEHQTEPSTEHTQPHEPPPGGASGEHPDPAPRAEQPHDDGASREQPRQQEADEPAAGPDAAPVEPAEISDEMNRQIDEAMAEMDRAAAEPPPAAEPGGEQPAQRPAPIRGPRVVEGGREHRKGLVVSVGPADIFLEFGPKELGVVPREQYPDAELPKAGDQLEVVVTRYSPDESLYLCARPGAVQKADWELLEPGQVVEARVTGVNKGGLELEVAGHGAFMPAGQVSLDRIEDLSVFVGEKLACRVQRVDRRGRGNIVLSRRDILAQERKERAKQLKDSLAEGQVVTGTVRKIMPFGAFVDIGGIDGLVHVSDLTHERAGHGEKFVQRHIQEGQKVEAQILKIDWEARRISLGIKQLQEDPFKAQAEQIAEGAEVTGKVTKILEFGAFVEIAPGVEGLVHISELAYRRVEKVEEVLAANQVVQVKVLKVDPDSRRISLSVKATQEPPKDTRKGRKGEERGPSREEILKETPALRRLREKFGKQGFRGGIG